MLMIDQYEESKGKNYNPYVFKERYRSTSEVSEHHLSGLYTSSFKNYSSSSHAHNRDLDRNRGGDGECGDEPDEFADIVIHSMTDNEEDFSVSANESGEGTREVNFSSASTPKCNTAERYVFWESIGLAPSGGERFVRTYEDVTLTDTSRYVLS